MGRVFYLLFFLYMKKLIVFDLDGTLAPSKGQLDAEMAKLLSRLLAKYKVSVITGGDIPQFHKQILPYITKDPSLLENFILCPTCATKMFVFEQGQITKRYSLDLSENEKKQIQTAFEDVMKELHITPEQTRGEIVEDRGTQVTFSALGQLAPLESKQARDPDFMKRQAMKKLLDVRLSGFAINLGGTTSVDVTKSGVDKAFGIRKLMEET